MEGFEDTIVNTSRLERERVRKEQTRCPAGGPLSGTLSLARGSARPPGCAPGALPHHSSRTDRRLTAPRGPEQTPGRHFPAAILPLRAAPPGPPAAFRQGRGEARHGAIRFGKHYAPLPDEPTLGEPRRGSGCDPAPADCPWTAASFSSTVPHSGGLLLGRPLFPNACLALSRPQHRIWALMANRRLSR
jgi:hypothetical protein